MLSVRIFVVSCTQVLSSFRFPEREIGDESGINKIIHSSYPTNRNFWIHNNLLYFTSVYVLRASILKYGEKAIICTCCGPTFFWTECFSIRYLDPRAVVPLFARIGF